MSYNFFVALDNKTLEIIVKELSDKLTNARINKPLYLGDKYYGFTFSKENNNSFEHGNIIFSLNPSLPLITYTSDRLESINSDTSFFSSLKKISYTTIESINKLKGERLVYIKLRASEYDITETNTSYDLILELYANHPNCYIVAYPSGKIISLYKEFTNIEKGIFVVKNSIYSYPKEKNIPTSFNNISDALPYFTNSIFRLLEKKSNGNIDIFNSLIKEINSSNQLYIYGKEILPYHFNLEDIKEIKVTDIYKILNQQNGDLLKQEKEKELIQTISKLIKSSDKKINNFISDQKKAKNNLIYKEYGQLIYMYQGEIKRGDKELKTDNYVIPLDKELDPPHNANKYFRKYQKAKSAIEILDDLIIKAKDENEYLRRKLVEASDGSSRDIVELKSELLSLGYLKKGKGKNFIQKVSKGRKYHPHFIIFDNFKIGYGMNGLQNEELTFNIAKDDDLFFHVKDYPGSHIILFGKQDEENILLCCELALFLSHLDSGEIMVTKKKFVKKNSLKTGLVKIKSYNSYTLKKIREESLTLFKEKCK